MKNTVNANELRMNIIDQLTEIHDIKKLKLLNRQVEKLQILAEEQKSKDPQLSLADSFVKIDKSLSFQDILDEQNYESISYEKFRRLADQIKWDHSLDELLRCLD